MRQIFLAAILMVSSQLGWGAAEPSSGPGQERDWAAALAACREAPFSQRNGIVKAIQSHDIGDILQVIGSALEEWKTTPTTSTSYPATSFCLHELVPAYLPLGALPESPSASNPPASVLRLRDLGITSFYVGEDWVVRNPMDLSSLATEHLDSRWGRHAFLMMTKLGWSIGDCREGPGHQFREVIRRGEPFLKAYPDSETTNDVRLEVANAYATWWTLSARPPDLSVDFSPEPYKRGGEDARNRAMELYVRYLDIDGHGNQVVEQYLKELRQRDTVREINYFCEEGGD